MKAGRVILTIVLAGMVCFAWFSWINGIGSRSQQYKEYVAMAQDYAKRELYQLSVQSYEKALEIKDSSSIREEWIAAYFLGYEDEVFSASEYISALNTLCTMDEKNAEKWETLISFCLEKGDYKNAYKYLTSASDAGAKSDTLTELKDTVIYSYTESGKAFYEVVQGSDGYSAVYDGSWWGIMDPSGEWLYECGYIYAGGCGKEKYVFLTSSRGSYIQNTSGVILSKLNIGIDEVKQIESGLLPVSDNGIWRFYDYINEEYVLEQYEDVSCFSDNVAAVKSNGNWMLIRVDGSSASNSRFDDIKLMGNGEYIYDGIMIAESDGNYGMYDASGKQLNSFTASDMDVYLGGYIAYQDASGKWGYVDKDGKEVITPQYEDAKSFSDGLGAVCLDGKWGYINSSGKLVIENVFLDAGHFTDQGVAYVSSVEGEHHMLLLRFNGGK